MKKVIILLVCSAALSLAFGQGKKPITHETMWMMKRVGAPAISPDGQWTVFSVTEPSYDEKEQVNDLWIVPTNGSTPPRKITSGKAGENEYSFSPDGRYISFVAKREADEVPQVYTINIKEGGEAQRFSTLCTGASSPQWSPDGKMILFTSRVYPNCYSDSTNKKMEEEKKKVKYKARVFTTFPIRNFDKWIDEKQLHAFVQPFGQEGAAKDLFTNVSLSKTEGFEFMQASWSADSKEIVFAASPDRTSAAYQEPSFYLYKVSVHGGDAVQLTRDKNDYSNPVITPDGHYLLCTSSPNRNYKVYNQGKLTRFDWPSMANKAFLAEKLDRPINNFVVNGEILYMSVEDEGRDKIYSVLLNGASPQLLTSAATGCYTNLRVSQSNQTIVADYEHTSMPPEVVRVNKDGSHTMLTTFNAEKLAALDLSPAEIVWFISSRGKKIRSVLVKPAGFDPAKKYPLLVLLHGGPAGSWKENWSYRWNYHLLAQPGYVVIGTDYTGSTGYGEKFGQDIQYDPFRGPGLEIEEGAADAIKRFSFIDGSRQAAAGGSYGGHLANWLQATTTHYKCLISHAGLVNSISQWGTSDGIYGREVMNGGPPWTDAKTWKEQNPFRYAANFKTPMLITVGEIDYRVPINNSIENWHILQRQKVPGKLIVFPEENHWILKAEDSRFFYKEVQEWLKKYL
jgi:dipeptidyl aminopeptidase/acylaminoacyl peptidase